MKVTKRLLVLTTLAVFVIAALVGCSSQAATNQPPQRSELPKNDSANSSENQFYQPTITVESAHIDESAIAKSLLDKYLQHFMDKNTPNLQMLKDYRIKEIKIIQTSSDGFFFSADFSVQAYVDNSDWVAGNGVIKDQGWIEDKEMFINVVRKGTMFTMTGWGTNP